MTRGWISRHRPAFRSSEEGENRSRRAFRHSMKSRVPPFDETRTRQSRDVPSSRSYRSEKRSFSLQILSRCDRRGHTAPREDTTPCRRVSASDRALGRRRDRKVRSARTGRAREGTFARNARGRGSASTGGNEKAARSAGALRSASTGGCEAGARSAGARASASTGGCEASAGSAEEEASASTGGCEASARSAGARASASTGGGEASARSAGALRSASTGGSEAAARSAGARRSASPRTPCSCFAASRARRSQSPRTPCTGFAASRARRCPSPRTPCTCFASSRARRCFLLRTPCTGFAPSRARRCSSPRTPCTCFAPSRARRSESPRTPCSFFVASRARRSPSPGIPCKSTLPCPSRAGTSDLAVPSPPQSAVACRDSSAWRRVFARSGVASSIAAREDLKRKGAFLGPIRPRRRDVSRLPGASLVERGNTRFHRMAKRSSRSIFALLR